MSRVDEFRRRAQACRAKGDEERARYWESRAGTPHRQAELVQDRSAFLQANVEKMMTALMGNDDPVALAIDLSDPTGREVGIALGIDAAKADEAVNYYRGDLMSATAVTTADWATVERLMPLTSPTGAQTVKNARAICEATGHKLLIAICAGGNQYLVAPRREPIRQTKEYREPAPDGQHRHRRSNR